MSLADLALNAHKTYTDAIDREDDAREIFYRYVTYNSEGKLNLTGVKYMLIDEFGFDEKDENEIYKMFDELDENNNGLVSFDEFILNYNDLVKKNKLMPLLSLKRYTFFKMCHLFSKNQALGPI